jgi:hypothetical protein
VACDRNEPLKRSQQTRDAGAPMSHSTAISAPEHPCLSALPAKGDRYRVFPVIRWGAFFNFASGNPANHDSGADHVGRAFLAF